MADMYEWAKRVASSKSAKAPEGAPESMNAERFLCAEENKTGMARTSRWTWESACQFAEAYASERVAQLKRGDPKCGRTADEEHRPLVCYVCADRVPVSFNFCLKHKDEYESLREQVQGLRAALTEAQNRIWEHHEIGHIRRAYESGPGGPCDLCGDGIFKRIDAALATQLPTEKKSDTRKSAENA